jgi:gas vesicle protein
MSAGKVLIAGLAGIATGTVVGLFFAPKKGTETRKKVFKKSGQYVDSIKEKFSDFMDSVADTFETAEAEGGKAVKKGKAKLKEVEKEAKSAVKEAKAAVA